MFYLFLCSHAVSPEFSVIAVVNDSNTTNGSSVTFTCSTLGGPDNVFVWILTNSSIDLEIRAVSPPVTVSEVVAFLQYTYTVLQQNSDGGYVIDSVNATENGGTYTCVVVNVAGFNSDEVLLLVQPTITRQPENVLTFMGENISLSCQADSFPPPTYAWFRQATEGDIIIIIPLVIIIVSENESRLMLANGGKDLLFSGIDYSDAGSYFCRANSSSGYADSRSATITGTHTDTDTYIHA